MTTGGDNHCLPMKRIINTVKSLVVSFCQKPIQTGGDNLYVPPEIIINILKRLRVKSLVRFQCVCKDWRNLLKSPSFIAEHCHHSALNNPLILDGTYLCLFRCNMGTVKGESIPALESLRHCTGIFGSSNGLLSVKLGYENRYPPTSLLLLNPATREVRQVPRSTNDDGRFLIVDSGFGYSHVVRDYKIVIILKVRNRNQNDLAYVHQVEVFSLRTGSWKRVEFGVIRRIKFHSQSVTVNGAMFWLGCHHEDHRGVIVSFDLTTESFTLIPIPCSTPIICRNRLGVYKNKVAMFDPYRRHEFELWVLEEESCAYGKRWVWTQKYLTTETSPLFPHLPLFRNELACYNAKGDSAFLFNTTANSILKTNFVYVESLVSMCDTYIE